MLDKKYRPQSIEQMFGNKVMLESLQSVLDRDIENVPRTFLFQGSSGCGKTTLARITANLLNANENNLKEYNISNTRGIDQARAIIDKLNFAPLGGGNKVIILNEVHKATNEFQNAMLDVLEDPPSHVFFILCTTEPNKLLPTIRNNQRGMTFEVEELRKKDIIDLLNSVLEKEEVNDLSKDIINEIAKASQGSPRRALVILDSIIDMQNEDDIFDFIKKRTYDEKSVIELCRALNERKGWKTISSILKELNGEAEGIRYVILEYFNKVLLSRDDQFISTIISEFSEPFINSKRAGLTNACYVLTKLHEN